MDSDSSNAASNLLSESTVMRMALKRAIKNQKRRSIYARWAAQLNAANISVAFERAKVKCKVSKLSSSWRAVDEKISNLRNRGLATADVAEKKGTHCAFFDDRCVHLLCLRFLRLVSCSRNQSRQHDSKRSLQLSARPGS